MHHLVLGTLLSPQENGTFFIQEEGALVYDEKGIIQDIGSYTDLSQRFPHAIVLDKKNYLILPGLIDTHNHISQYTISGAADIPINEWLETYVFPEEIRFSKHLDQTRLISRDFFQKALAYGTTCMATFTTSSLQATNVVFEEAATAKIRALIGLVLMDINSPHELLIDLTSALQDLIILYEKWHQKGQLEVSVNPRFAVTCSEMLLRTAVQFAKKHELLFHTHLDFMPVFLDPIKQNYPWAKNLLHLFSETNCYTERSLFAHATGLSYEDWVELGQQNAAISHCPNSNIFWKMGLLPITKLIDFGCRLSLGTDSGGGATLSLFEVMRSACEISKILEEQQGTTGKLLVQDLLRLATLDGAKALGLSDQIGSLEKGKQADFIVVQDRLCDPLYPNSLTSYQKPLERLERTIFRSHPNQVVSVYIKGQQVL